MNDYNLCINGMRAANEIDIADYQALISALGAADGSMNGADILDQKEKSEQGKMEAESAADWARWKARLLSVLLPEAAYIYEWDAEAYEEEARQWQEIIQWCQEQIDIYDGIEAATAGLFVSGSAMRSVAGSALKDVTGAFQNGVYAPNLNATWRKQLQSQAEITATEYLLKQGVTRQEIRNMLGLGYTATDIKYQWDKCETDLEKQFFRNLMEGTEQSYIEAFETDPYKLSEELTFIMSEYSYRLLVHNQLDQLTELNNAVLSSERYRTTDEHGEYIYRDVYLEKLYTGTSGLLYKDAVILAAMNPGDPGYAKLYENYQKRAALTNMWAVENVMVDYLETHYMNGEEAHQLSVSDIIYKDGGEIEFKFKRYSPFFGEYVTNRIDGDFLEGGSLVESADQLQKLRDLEIARDNLLKEYATKFLEGAAVIAATAFAPEMAILVSIGTMLLNGSAESISGLEDLFEKESTKTGIGLSQVLASNVINCLVAYQQASINLDSANAAERIAWFGAGGTYTIEGGKFNPGMDGNIDGISYSGLYNPDSIRLMAQWEQNGLQSIPMWGPNRDECLDNTQKQDLLKRIALDNNFSESVMKEYEDLLEGGNKISEITNYKELNDKIHIIEDAYGGGMDIQRQCNNQTEVSAATAGK